MTAERTGAAPEGCTSVAPWVVTDGTGAVHGDLKEALQRQLGRQLDQLQSTDLTKRIGELTTQNQELNSQLTQLQHEKQELERRLAETNDDLVAARASLRRMIRTENT